MSINKKEKYEISLWEDYQDSITVNGETRTFLNERKLCVIGANQMNTQVRALEPKFVENINGTHTLTFKMFYKYKDEFGEEFDNPFLHLLVNERKVKVLWKNEWYDLVIKKCQEDSAGKSIVYTCTDLFINELSKSGFELNFSTDLQNNIGTVEDLATTTLEGTTWQYDTNSDQIYQTNTEPVYDVTTLASITCQKQLPGQSDTSATIPSGARVLVFYSGISAILDGLREDNTPQTEFQLLYASEGYATGANDNLVVNGDCYLVTGITCTFNNDAGVLTIKKNNTTILVIPVGQGVSKDYRANRLVRSPKSEYDAVIGRYVTICKETSTNKKVYLIEATQYTDPLAVVNLVANPNQFKDVNGWIGVNNETIIWSIYPKFDINSTLASYTAKSYIKLNGTVYNTGLSSNISYLTPTNSEIRSGVLGGFQKGEKYVFRFKAVNGTATSPSSTTYVTSKIASCAIKQMNSYTHAPIGNSYFNDPSATLNDGWVECVMTCTTACPSEEIKNIGMFITISSGDYWFEDIQFFKYMEGVTSYQEGAQTSRMDPGEINLQSIAEKTYKYYYPPLEQTPKITDPKKVTYISIGTSLNNNYEIQYNNYEKLSTISVKESNRFNILQTIAETFRCWVRFRIEHEENGKVIFINGIPQKFVTFKADVGEDKGLSFEYGIDLKTISRIIDSDQIATKVIVLENSNEFAQNGFCTITRSNENYSKANFILNFDYYINQGLLNSQQIYKDLYGTSTNDIGYYYNLRWNNREYDGYSDELITKRMDQTKQNSQLVTYRQYLVSSKEKLNNIKDDVIKLAAVSTWEEAEAYAKSHSDNTKVQSLMNSYAELNNQINYYSGLISNAEAALAILNNKISELEANIQIKLNNIKALNLKFNQKYGNYIQEGTWIDESYIDDDKYYLDAVNTAYTSSRPQITYSISVIRLSSLEEYSSKVFKVGDICYMIDREYFGYSDIHTRTPYKEKILVSEITSNFDSPEKDIIQVRNYETKFDDLFQRIAAQTQSLQYSEGEYTRAASAVTPDRQLSFSLLQDTFDHNRDLILNASNQDVIWDDTGITVINKLNSADKTRIIAGGIFVTNDGGLTWKNAVRGDGISADLLTAGKINTSEIYLYDGNNVSFRWDSDGISAYYFDEVEGVRYTNFNRFVRHDKFGLYGYDNKNFTELTDDFLPDNEEDIWENSNTRFALTWRGFLFNSKSTDGYLRIGSSEAEIDNAIMDVTEDFDERRDYAAGELCIYNGVEYRFTQRHYPDQWNSSHVASTGYSVFNNLNSYSTGDLVLYNRNRYRFTSSFSGGEGVQWDPTKVSLVTMSNFDTSTPYAIGDIVIHNGSSYMFKSIHAAGAWNDAQVDKVIVLDYKLIYGGIRTVNNNSEVTLTPKFYITQNGTAFFDGALMTHGNIIGGSIKIGPHYVNNYFEDRYAFEVSKDGILEINAFDENNSWKNFVRFDPLEQRYIFEGALAAEAVFTDSLYAELGDISELTVDRLSTSRRVRNYIQDDRSDDNYVNIQDGVIEFRTGTLRYNDGPDYTDKEAYPSKLVVPQSQASNRYNSPIWWSKESSYQKDGYPLDENRNQIYTTTQSDIGRPPVKVFNYQELVKAKIDFEQVDSRGNYIPTIVMGAGDQNGRSKGYIRKNAESFDLWYLNASNEEMGMFINDNYTDVVGLRKPTQIDFRNWNATAASGYISEIYDGEVMSSFEVLFDGVGRPTCFIDAIGHRTVVLWE